MAIIRNTASMMLKGKVGATTFYVAESRQLARQAMNNSNYGQNASRTDLQQARRVKWSNLVNYYSANKAWMKKAYENLKPGVSIFNRFMQLNIGSAEVALTKSEAQAKVWVPARYRVSQGSLQSLAFGYDEGLPYADIVSTITVAEDTTVAQIAANLIANNPNLRNGDAIVFVSFTGTNANPGAAEGVISASYQYRELVLNNADESVFAQKYPDFQIANNRITCAVGRGELASVWIHTRKNAGSLYVSTQDMALNDVEINSYDEWRSAAQVAKAIASYGESTTVPLAPGGQGSLGSGNDSSSGGGSTPGADGGGSLG